MLGEIIGKLRGQPKPVSPPPEASIISLVVEPPKSSGPKPELINPSDHPLGRDIRFVEYAGLWNRHVKSEERLST